LGKIEAVLRRFEREHLIFVKILSFLFPILDSKKDEGSIPYL
jgi:hypothetical protein